MNRMNEDYRRLQNSDIALFAENFHKFTSSFDCYTWTNKEYSNNYFLNCANRAFEDFLEFYNACWGMPLDQFKKEYIQTNEAEFINEAGRIKGGRIQMVRFKTAGSFITYFPVHENGSETIRIFPAAVLNIWDLDTKVNIPFIGVGYTSLTPNGIDLLMDKEKRWASPANTIICPKN